MDDPEQRLAEALRARATQAGHPAPPPPPPQQVPGFRSAPPNPAPGSRRDAPARSLQAQAGWALLIALIAGAVFGCALGLLSVLAPGLLPPLG
ncbi:hypothetical protein PA7_22440 [Pseudonocardia asaccharolytica DSM 44247 = NBRC 16224]|uniref:Uncharacterized protein n=2 Tax=Pseudonocardia asaccharolytica TaxID=54010 RepID=A0A511D146_9PSEU|nr:hypothetical protein PA7_22440 [Pseudonocardia asaccharolytica DSM 44247 = NBRC 16224]